MAYFPTGTSGIPGTLTTQSGSTTTTDTRPFQPSLRATVAFGEPRSRTAHVDASQTSPLVPQGVWPQDVAPLLLHLTSDCLDGKDNDGDGKVDAADPGCPGSGGSLESGETAENRPPVAVNDHYRLAAGAYIWTTALKNDFDPDGDKFTARVTRIEFRRKEWSGMDHDGTFSYVAGTNARIAMKKVIVYHLVDARGMKSESAKITIAIAKPGVRRPSPLNKRPTKATSAAVGDGGGPARGRSTPATVAGSTVESSASCRRRRSARSMRQPHGLLARRSPRPPTACAQYGANRTGLAGCAQGLVAGPLFRAGDKQIIRSAAKNGACLIFKQTLDRTLRHPRAGEWSKPEFHGTHSYSRASGGPGSAASPRSGSSLCRAPVALERADPRGSVSRSEPDRRRRLNYHFEAVAIAPNTGRGSRVT